MKRRDFLELGAMASMYPITTFASRLGFTDQLADNQPHNQLFQAQILLSAHFLTSGRRGSGRTERWKGFALSGNRIYS